MASNHPWYFDRRPNGKKFACRSKGGQTGIMIKKAILRRDDVDYVVLSSGDSSCFIMENKRKHGLCADVHEQEQIMTKKRVKLEATHSSVLSKKISFGLVQNCDVKKSCADDGCFIRRKKFACRSQARQDGIVIKKAIPRDEVDYMVLSSGDSCFILENKRKSGLCADLEKERIPTKKRVKLEATPSSVVSKKISFGLVQNCDVKKSSADDGRGYRRVDEYELLQEISHGSYGTVYKAREKKTGQIVAIKDEFDGFCKSSLREIDVLKSVIHHPSFVEFKEVVVDEYDGVYIVMEYIESDLRRAMKSIKIPFEVSEVKTLMKQLLDGVNFLHENGVMHRDLKPSNILLNDKGELKICDFGLSRRFERTFDSYSPRVVTLWYKAPELLLGAEKYSCAIDMWAVGCIMAELLLEEVIFKGNSEIDQLQKIFEILGTPNDMIWPGFSSLPGNILKFVEQPLNLLSRDFPMLSELGVDLLSTLLVYNPEERITAKDALDHDWFREI